MMTASGQLIGAVAAMDIFERMSVVPSKRHRVTVVDCNMTSRFIASVCAAKQQAGAEVWIEPVSVAKCVRAVDAIRARGVFGVSPNEAELRALCVALSSVDSAVLSLQGLCDVLFAYGVETVLVKVFNRFRSFMLVIDWRTTRRRSVARTGALWPRAVTAMRRAASSFLQPPSSPLSCLCPERATACLRDSCSVARWAGTQPAVWKLPIVSWSGACRATIRCPLQLSEQTEKLNELFKAR